MTGIKVCIVTIIFTAVYIFSSVLFSNLLFYGKSNGSLIKINNKIIGSSLIGQEFKKSRYFTPRPSVNNYKNDISGCSNFPYYSEELKKDIQNRYLDFQNLNSGGNPDLNLISESASGLDPHITYNGAISQVTRISKTGGINNKEIIKIINKHSHKRILGLFGEKIINTLELNSELYKIYAKKT